MSSSRGLRQRSNGRKQEPKEAIEAPAVESVPPKAPVGVGSLTKRILSGFILLSSFALIVWAGHLVCAVLTLLIQILVFKEIVYLGKPEKDEAKIPLFRVTQWSFLLITLFYLYGEGGLHLLNDVLLGRNGLGWMVSRLLQLHDFIALAGYITVFMTFVLSLKKGMYQTQITYFARVHVTILYICLTSSLAMKNLFAGLIWYLLPAMIVTVNDIFAFACGKMFGRTPLIQLSPKKTWEGFVGGWLFTMVFTVIAAYVMCMFDYFVCPKTDFSASLFRLGECTRAEAFIPYQVELPLSFLVGHGRTITWFKFVNHSLVLGLFGSLVAPFGGFFASGLKRAFKIKDFGETIPGHGGWTDRFDCQFVMSPFVYVYRVSFVSILAPAAFVMKKVLMLSEDEQLEILRILKNRLE